MAHHDRGRMVVALDQQAGFFPDRQGNGAEDTGHALGAEPCFRRFDQRLAGFRVLRFEKAEIAGAGPHALFDRLGEGEMIDMGGDAADDTPITAGEEILRLCMAEKRVLAGLYDAVDFAFEWRHPVGIIGVQPPWQVHKGLFVGLGNDGGDDQIGMSHGRAFAKGPQQFGACCRIVNAARA